jgi:hypothetical protein
MLASVLLYIRLAIARSGWQRILETIKDERAVQAWRRGDSTLFVERRIDLSRHLAERRSLAFVLLAYSSFILGAISMVMEWPRLLTVPLMALAIGLFAVAVAQSPPEDTKPSVVQVPPAGRNAPCPCGSGKKYKHCHGAPN